MESRDGWDGVGGGFCGGVWEGGGGGIVLVLIFSSCFLLAFL